MAFILFSVAGLACGFSLSVAIYCSPATDHTFVVFRFVGAMSYLIVRLFAGE